MPAKGSVFSSESAVLCLLNVASPIIKGGIFMEIFVTPVVDEWGTTTYQPTTLGLTVMVVLMVAVFLAGVALFGKERKSSNSSPFLLWPLHWRRCCL